jgi:hypothetical protein
MPSMFAENVFARSRPRAVSCALLAALVSCASTSKKDHLPADGATPAIDAAAGTPGDGGGTAPAPPIPSAPADDAAASGSSQPDGTAPSDAARTAVVDAASGAGEGGVEGCDVRAIDGYSVWVASGETGMTVPPKDDLLVDEGGRTLAKVAFVGTGPYHIIALHLANDRDRGAVDLSRSSGFTMTYSATADLWVQLRASTTWNGGSHYVTMIPSTGGQMQTRTFTFERSRWTALDDLGIPTRTFDAERAEVRGFVFVGRPANTLVFSSFKVDGYTPPCVHPKGG